MSEQDQAFFATFKVVLGVLIVMAILFYVIAKIAAGLAEPEGADEASRAVIEERIAPVGEVAVGEAPAQTASEAGDGGPALSGKQVVTQVCAACHQTGTLDAPKIGIKDEWASRLAKGMETLMDHAINGFKQMPAKGGDPSLSEAEIRDAIVYMLEQSDLAVDDTGAAQAAAAQAPEPADAAGVEAAAPSTAEEDTAAPAGGDLVPADVDLGKGQSVYNEVCMSCHDTGAAGAPKKGDTAAWEPRIAKGWDTLTKHAINGFNAMPAKGGRTDLADQDVEAATAYLIEHSQ